MTRRDEVIKKIATLLFSENDYNKVAENKRNKTAEHHFDAALLEKCSSASQMLKSAAQEIRSLKRENEKLAADKEDLNQKLDFIEKHAEAEKLANTMVAKGMLKVSDIDKKTLEIMALDNEGFNIFKDAIENTCVEKTASKEGANSLDFMYEYGEEDCVERPSMVDAAKGYIK